MDKVGVDGAIFHFSLSITATTPAMRGVGNGPIPADRHRQTVDRIILTWPMSSPTGRKRGRGRIRIMLTKENKREPNDLGLDRIAYAAVRHDFRQPAVLGQSGRGHGPSSIAIPTRDSSSTISASCSRVRLPRRRSPGPTCRSAGARQAPERGDQGQRRLPRCRGAVSLSGHLGSAGPRVDAWGFDRCLWGTGLDRAFAVVNYQQAVEPFLKTSRLSDTERAMLMGGAAPRLMAGHRRRVRVGWVSLWRDPSTHE